MKEYLNRNLTVCRALGVKAGMQTALVRLRKQQRPPKWLVNLLERETAKLPDVIKNLVQRRDAALSCDCRVDKK